MRTWVLTHPEDDRTGEVQVLHRVEVPLLPRPLNLRRRLRGLRRGPRHVARDAGGGIAAVPIVEHAAAVDPDPDPGGRGVVRADLVVPGRRGRGGDEKGEGRDREHLLHGASPNRTGCAELPRIRGESSLIE